MESNFQLNGFSVEGSFKRKATDKIYNGLKCYEIIDGIVTGVSLVSKPAHGKNFKIIDKKNRLIMGTLLSPNIMIHRIDRIFNEEYYVYFTEESIEKIKSNSEKR